MSGMKAVQSQLTPSAVKIEQCEDPELLAEYNVP